MNVTLFEIGVAIFMVAVGVALGGADLRMKLVAACLAKDVDEMLAVLACGPRFQPW